MGPRQTSRATGSAAEIAVLERRSWWTPELQRQFVGEEVRIRSGRVLSDLASLVASGPNVLVLELELAPAGCLQWLGRRSGPAEHLPVIVIGTSPTAELEWLVRELGAVHFVPETIPGYALADLCRRQFYFQRRGRRDEMRENKGGLTFP